MILIGRFLFWCGVWCRTEKKKEKKKFLLVNSLVLYIYRVISLYRYRDI